MKIAVPWPVKPASCPRVKEAMSLWENPNDVLLCLVKESNDPFLKNFSTSIMPRDSTSIGSVVPKCFIYDMVKTVRSQYPNEDWYGFGNSDLVPVGDILDGHRDYEALIFHRTEIPNWENRFNQVDLKNVPKSLSEDILQMRQEGASNRKIARKLNRSGVSAPPGQLEWTQTTVQDLFKDQGYVFFWGQDLFLFRQDVIDFILEGFLKEKDYVLGTGGYDPRLSRYLVQNHKTARVINKVFHKEHHSEWLTCEAEFIHNDGEVDIVDLEDRFEWKDEQLLRLLCKSGNRSAIPRYIRWLTKKFNPELGQELFGKQLVEDHVE